MHTKICRGLLLTAVLVLLMQAGSVFAQTCGDGEQPCNGRCIDQNNICIFEPLPGGPDEIAPGGAPLDVFLTYVNGGAGMSGIWQWGFRIGTAIAVLNGVYAGFQIATSNGDGGKVDEGKKRFIGSAIGLMMLILSGVIMNFINPDGFTI
jgi:hypothetical protein